MITSTIKLPEDLVARIDERIKSKEFSTRADFILHALRLTLSRYGEIKRRLIEQNKSEIPSDEELQTKFKNYFEEFLIDYQEYKGKPIQINTRVPEGLDERITLLIKPEYGLKRRTDFTRIAVLYLLLTLDEMDGVFKNAQEFAARQKEVREIFNQYMNSELSQGKDMGQILDDLREIYKKKGFR